MNENMVQMMGKLQRFQEDMSKMQVDLKAQTVVESAGDGAVTVTVDGQQQVVAIFISPDMLNAENSQQVQDLLITAVNGAVRKAQELVKSEMEKLTRDMNLPNIPGLF